MPQATTQSSVRDPVLFSEFTTGYAIQDAYHEPTIYPGYEERNIAKTDFWWDMPWDWWKNGEGSAEEKNEDPKTKDVIPPENQFLLQKETFGDFLMVLLFIGAALFVVKYVRF